MDLAQVAASLRTARETSLELARATAAYPVVAEHFQDAADSYLNVPPIPPDASLDAMSRSQIDRLEESFSGTGNGVYEAIDTLNQLGHPVLLAPSAPSSTPRPSLPAVVALFRKMLEDDRRRAGRLMGQAVGRRSLSDGLGRLHGGEGGPWSCTEAVSVPSVADWLAGF